MDYLATNLATKPRKRKTTVYISQEVYELMCEAPGTISTQVNYNFLVVGAQQRKLPGVPPRNTEDFLKFLGAADVVPQWQRLGYHDREELRRQAQNAVGYSNMSPEALEQDRIAWAQECADFFCEGFSTFLAEEHFIVEELQTVEIEKTENFNCLFSQILSESTPARIDEEQTPWKFYAKPIPVKDLPKQSEKLSELVALAQLYCPDVLAGVAGRAEGRTLEAVERELELLVGINRPKTPEAGKRRFWRNSS